MTRWCPTISIRSARSPILSGTRWARRPRCRLSKAGKVMPDIVDMFDAQASRSPALDAVLHDNGSTTYGQLNLLARQIFSNLREFRQPRALLYLPQSSEAYAAMLGVLMAGGYYCPVNLAHPADRQKQVIQLFDPDI